MKILIRQARLGDEIGISEFIKEGIKRKNWLYTGKNKYTKKDIEKTKNDLKKKPKDQIHLLAIDPKTKKILGSTMMNFRTKGRIRHRVDLGWGLHPDYQKQGIGTQLLKRILEIAKKKGFIKAEAEAAIENKASIKLAKKLGFKIEGLKKKAMITDDGRYIDTYILGKIL